MENIRALLLVGGPEYHNLPLHYAELTGIFAGEAGADVRITSDLNVLDTATLAGVDVLINWSTFVQPTPAQVSALLAAIEDGLGFFGIHGATATFWNNADYLTMLGSRFLRHDPYKQFQVDIDDPSHPITHGVAPFDVEDELYQLGGNTSEFPVFAAGVLAGTPYDGRQAALGEGPLAPGIGTLASAEGHPLLYAREYGNGRVHYNALGHDEKALRSPQVRRLFRQGLAWVAGRDN